jgi:hypothetical protein
LYFRCLALRFVLAPMIRARHPFRLLLVLVLVLLLLLLLVLVLLLLLLLLLMSSFSLYLAFDLQVSL